MKRSIPIPEAILNFNSESDFEEECQNERKRTYPHERGQWTTFPFVPISQDKLSDILELLPSQPDLTPMEDIHMSLIRGHYTLRHHQIGSFVAALSKKLSTIHAFSVCLDNFKLFENEDHSRLFVCLCQSEVVSKSIESKSHLMLSYIKQVLDDFDARVSLPNKQDELIFHSSIAWCLPPLKDKVQQFVDQLNEFLDEAIIVPVNVIKVNIGNQTHRFDLKL